MKYLKKFENQSIYPEMEFFIGWFDLIHQEIYKKEGWTIFFTDNVYEIETIDDPNDFFNDDDLDIETPTIKDAVASAKKLGLIVGEWKKIPSNSNLNSWKSTNVILGYNGISFIDHPEELYKYEEMYEKELAKSNVTKRFDL